MVNKKTILIIGVVGLLIVVVIFVANKLGKQKEIAGYKCESFYFFGSDLGANTLGMPVKFCNATHCVEVITNKSIVDLPYYCKKLEHMNYDPFTKNVKVKS